MIAQTDILFEDNHIIVVNKRSGDLVQPDPSGEPALEQAVAEYLRVKGGKPGAAFIGVVHRIDRPVSGAVLFAKTSKALVRLNEQLKQRGFEKIYWAIVENMPPKESDTLRHFILRNPKSNKSAIVGSLNGDAKEALMEYKLIGSSERYHLLEVKLLTGRHHQIRCQLTAIGCSIRGDLKYGAKRSNKDGSISLHSRSLSFVHPVSREQVTVIAPTPSEALWDYFVSK